ncbi:MAG TPA: A/G-specific adenine glycosylase [bacterium]|nr:A/G-specific adenine glycosylase [bacterium]
MEAMPAATVAGASDEDKVAFRSAVLDFYDREGRDFAWRATSDPWAILVSEVMLQQTQTARVVPKFDAWMARFPDAATLAAASTADVYDAWRGLGYNSRGIRLRACAAICVERYGGIPPVDERLLLELPGVGRYTARAVLAFAYGIPTAFLETNIRAALIFHFFPKADRVSDRALEAIAASLLVGNDPRTWYYALMDYGAWLKKHEPNPTRKAAAYARQTRFEGSVRQARGALLRTIANNGQANLEQVSAEAGIEYGLATEAAAGLLRDGLIKQDGQTFSFVD